MPSSAMSETIFASTSPFMRSRIRSGGGTMRPWKRWSAFRILKPGRASQTGGTRDRFISDPMVSPDYAGSASLRRALQHARNVTGN